MSHTISKIALLALVTTGSLSLNPLYASDTVDWSKPGWQLTEEERMERLEVLATMSEEERQALRDSHKAARDSMSEEDRAALKEEHKAHRQAKREEWEALSDEEKEARKAEMKARYEALPDDQKQVVDEIRAARAERRGSRSKGKGHKRGHDYPESF